MITSRVQHRISDEGTRMRTRPTGAVPSLPVHEFATWGNDARSRDEAARRLHAIAEWLKDDDQLGVGRDNAVTSLEDIAGWLRSI